MSLSAVDGVLGCSGVTHSKTALDGSARVSNVANIAGTDVNPQADVIVVLKPHWVGQTLTRTWTFSVTGRGGV